MKREIRPFSRRSRAVTAKKCRKKHDARTEVLFLLIEPILYFFEVLAVSYVSVHTYPDICESATISFWVRLPSHVSAEPGIRIRNFLNPLSRVEIFEFAMNTKSRGLQIRIFLFIR